MIRGKKHDFEPYRGMSYYRVLKFGKLTRVSKHSLANNEVSDGKRPTRSAAATGRLFLPAPATRLSLLGSLGWVGADPEPHAGSDWDTVVDRLSGVVT